MEGSYKRAFTVFGAIVLVLIIMNKAIPVCRLLQVEGSYMPDFTVVILIKLIVVCRSFETKFAWYLRYTDSKQNVGFMDGDKVPKT